MNQKIFSTFTEERMEIGAGMAAKVYSWNGYAYKCFKEGYPEEWVDYEYNQQNEICKSKLPVPRYYASEFPGTIKMELLSGNSMLERMEAMGTDIVMKDFMACFLQIHNVKGLNLPRVSEYIYNQIEEAPVTNKQKMYAKKCFMDVETNLLEEEVLCHMDYHFLNVMYEGDAVRIIDWMNAKNGKPIWDYARTYVLYYENIAEIVDRYKEEVMALEGYAEEAFCKAVYTSAIIRLNENDTKQVRKLIDVIESELYLLMS